MTRMLRLPALILVLTVTAAACGDDDAATTTTTTSPPTTAATVAPPTTVSTTAPTSTTTTSTTTTSTTTTSATTTTTTTTTRVGDAAADAVVSAKVAAAAAAVPANWDTAIVTNQFGDEADDVVFGPCSPGGFDLAKLDAATLAVAELDAAAPLDTALPAPPQANLEARVFESESVAADAFAVLEEVLGSDDGRQCVADTLTEDLGAELPPDAEFTFELESLDAGGADVGARIVIDLAIQGVTAGFTIDLVADRDGDCTVFAAFFGFGAEFDPALRDAIISAASSA
jgi:hypothetical protein